MSTNRDWLLNNSEGILSMARDWKSVAGTNAPLWGISPNVLQELNGLIQAADTAFATAKNETTRTPVATAQCKEAFDAFAMRDMKRRYFLTLPLVDSDYISLANKGYRIWYSIAAPGETPPANPDELRRSFFTKRKKDVIEFEFGDSGKNCFIAVQIENEGKKGPWGPLTSALIP
jgi:hypothetical protein